MKWTFSVGQPPHIVMWVKHLVHIKHFRLDLHKMVATDLPGCYHTHPAKAFRIVLWNGYVEELEDGTLKTWRPGMMGWVQPELCHRVHAFRKGFFSLSLWLRWPVSHKILLRGPGWPCEAVEKVEDAHQWLQHRLEDLIEHAEQQGFVCTIDLVPTQPLAVGGYKMRADVRPARK